MKATEPLPPLAADRNRRAARWCIWAFAGLLVGQALSLGYVATRLSPTPDEFPNLCAGLSYLRTGRFDFYSVNPPLIKVFAALPALAADLEVPPVSLASARPEFVAGIEVGRTGGQQAVQSLIAARWVAILFVLIGTVALYRLGNQLRGPVCGLIAAALWATSPLTLAYGPLLSFDVASCSVGLMATSTFIGWLRSKSLGDALIASLWLGLAILIKFTWLLLFVLWPVWAVMRLRSKRTQDSTTAKPLIRLSAPAQLAAILGIGWLLVNAGYRFQEFGMPLGEFTFVSELLSGLEQEQQQSLRPGNRFAGSFLASFSVPAPAPMVRGIDIQKRDFEKGLPAYRLGKWYETGIWYYYALGFAAKLPLGMLVLSILGTIVAIRDARGRVKNFHLGIIGTGTRGRKAAASLRERIVLWTTDEIIALIVVPGCVLLLISSQTGMNNHFRYALVLLGQLCLLAAIGVTSFAPHLRFPRAGATRAVCVLLLATTLVAPVPSFPYCHSYCNLAFGGQRSNADLLGGSAADWYQGWWSARRWLASRHEDGRRVVLVRSRWFEPQTHAFETRAVDAWNQGDAILLISAADRIDLQKRRPGSMWQRNRVALIGGGVEAYHLTASELSRVANSEFREVIAH